MSTKITEQWSDQDDYSLYQYEEIITENRDSFEKMMDALIAIRDQRLYRNTHKTFSEYCQRRWKFTARWANSLISGEQAIRSLENGKDTSHDLSPINIEDLKKSSHEAKSELAKEPPRRRGRVAKVALDKSGGKPPTRRQIKEASMIVSRKSAKAIAEAIARPRTKSPCSAYTVIPKTSPTVTEAPIAAVNGDPVSIVRACYEKHKASWNAIPPAPPMLVVETICKALQ